MTEAELRALCNEWQKRLRLQDWRVTAEIARYHELGEGTGAHVELALQRRAARIKVRHPDDEPPDGDHALDTEGYLVHELLHLPFIHYIPAKGPEEDAFEQALNALAEALVALKRESVPEMPFKLQRAAPCEESCECPNCIRRRSEGMPYGEYRQSAERREHQEEQMVGAHPPSTEREWEEVEQRMDGIASCAGCGKPFQTKYEKAGWSNGTDPLRFYHAGCLPEEARR